MNRPKWAIDTPLAQHIALQPAALARGYGAEVVQRAARHDLTRTLKKPCVVQGFFKVRGKRSDSGPGVPADVMRVLEDAWDGVLNSSITDPPGTIHSTKN
jgi:hypothetical protein